MKKYIFILFTLLFMVAGVSAQESAADSGVLRNKKGIPILPQKGDFAIGMCVNPFLDYLGNTFNGNTDNHFVLSSTTLYGKYYIENDAAVRVYLTWSNTHETSRNYVRDDAAFAADPLSQAQLIDTRIYKYDNLGIGVSYQKYRGYGRLLGFYGAYIDYYQSRTQYEYTYGNAITEVNTDPTDYWGDGEGQGRTLSDDNGIGRSLGAGLLGGVEYFFMPKISLGAELNIGYSYTWSTQSNAKFEMWDGGQVFEYNRTYSPGSHSSGFSTYIPSTYGGLFVMFHF
jgi:hypothetical protein